MTTDSPKASNSAPIQRMEPVSNWLVLWNMPGYMPDMEPYVLDSWESARDSLIDELEREMDSIDETLSGEHALVLAIESLRALAPFVEWSGYVGSYYYLLEATDEPTDDEREAQERESDDESPSPGDYVIRCDGFRYHVGIVEGKHVGTFSDFDDAESAVREHRARTSPNFWPSVWNVSDHGNVSLTEGWTW